MTLSAEPRAQIEVPEEAFVGDEPLVAVMRGGFVGALHRGTLTAVEASGEILWRVGDPHQKVFLRSGAKPFQVVPAILSGGIDRFGITESELAVLCASHSAEPRHTDAVLSVLSKIGLRESALRCGVHPPLHVPTYERLVQSATEPTPVCNNCSGAHTGMLVACVANGWPIDSYGSADHPLQIQTRQILGKFAGVPAESIELAVDNCHVPAFRLPLRNAALAFARLASRTDVSQELELAAERIVRAMTRNPYMVGGQDRFDSDLMATAAGEIVSKGGAEGFQGVGLIREGIGLALKISDGNARAVAPAVIRALGYACPGASWMSALEKYAKPEIHDLQDEPVGRLVPVFSIKGARSA